jgi:hypothetical protein
MQLVRIFFDLWIALPIRSNSLKNIVRNGAYAQKEIITRTTSDHVLQICDANNGITTTEVKTRYFLLSNKMLNLKLLSSAELSWSQVFKQLCKLDSSCPVIEISSF